MLTLGTIACLGAVFGVSSHLGYFIHGEHHMQAVRLFILLITSPFVVFAFMYRLEESVSITITAQKTIIAVFSYVVALTTSILVYRIAFHPLRYFPGPFAAKVTKLSHVLRLLKTSDNYVQADRLHKKYGEIVR